MLIDFGIPISLSSHTRNGFTVDRLFAQVSILREILPISQLFQTQYLNPVSHAQPVSQASISRERQYLTVPVSHAPVTHGPGPSLTVSPFRGEYNARINISIPRLASHLSISEPQYLNQYITTVSHDTPVSHTSISCFQYLNLPDQVLTQNGDLST